MQPDVRDVERELDAPDDPVTDLACARSSVGARDATGRLTALRRLALTLALVGIIVWSWRALQQLEHPDAVREGQHREIVSMAESPLHPSIAAPAADIGSSGTLLKGESMRALLDTEVERLSGSEATRERLKASAILLRRVTLVNLWATWCEPCTRELPGLKDMLEQGRRERGWGEETQFATLLVDDASTAEAAHRAIVASLPPGTVFLVDHGLGGGVRPALARSRVIADDASLPISLLFDCHRRLRWHHVGELRGPDFAALADKIERLRAERGTAACEETRAPANPPPLLPSAPRTPPPSKSLAAETDPTVRPPTMLPRPAVLDCDAQRPIRCGDDCCDRGENCRDCPSDCGCEDGEVCVQVVQNTPRCAISEAKVSP